MDYNYMDDKSGSSIEESAENTKKCKKIVPGIIGFFIGVAFSFAVFLVINVVNVNTTSADTDIEKLTESSNSKFSYIWGLVKNYYYEDVDDEKLIEGVYKGVVEALDDPYSEYYNEVEYKDLMASLTGNYAGIGAQLTKNLETGEVIVTKVYKGTPAEKSGVIEGDNILQADEFLAIDEDLDKFVQHIRGDAGSYVTLKIKRKDEIKDIKCRRADITVPTVESQMLKDKVGYIEVSQFATNTSDDFKKAIEDLKKSGMQSLIIDLRGNGGGLVDSATDMLDYILPKGITVYTLDKNGEKKEYKSDDEHVLKMPIVVLVDENSASASEIFAGAIRDYDYGTLLGTKTFGKGIVQSTIELSDGTALKLTTERYYTPLGECIHKKGIKPDVELEYEFMGKEDDEYSVDLDNQIQAGIQVLEGTYKDTPKEK